LEKTNPGLIMVSITPFGQTGPYKDFKPSDIALWAMGGLAYPFGDVDRPPVRVSHHSQAYLHAGAQGAAAGMIALYSRSLTGRGQHIDLSIQECVVRLHPTADWDQNRTPPIRTQGGFTTEIKRNVVWPCKDGNVVWFYWYGPLGRLLAEPLIQWMDEEGMGDDYLRNFEWEKIGPDNVTQELVDRLSVPTGLFFMAHTKAELFEGAIKHRVQLYPVSTSADIAASRQLADRNYWVELEHPELNDAFTYPGPFAKFSETPIDMRRRAPLIGEHNHEIYEGELGLSREALVMLKQAEVI
jgi:crotonobetainyl-CoA:carnitine CoA-transferase CaiB-like acyl-CoA transferase